MTNTTDPNATTQQAKWLQMVVPIIDMLHQNEREKEARKLTDRRMQTQGSLLSILGDEAASEILNSTDTPTMPDRYRLGEYEFGTADHFCATGFYVYLRLPDFLPNRPFQTHPRELCSQWIDEKLDLAKQVEALHDSLNKLIDEYSREKELKAWAAMKAEKTPVYVPQITDGMVEHYTFLKDLLGKIEKNYPLMGRYAAAMHLIAAVDAIQDLAKDTAEAVVGNAESDEEEYDDDDDDDNDDE